MGRSINIHISEGQIQNVVLNDNQTFSATGLTVCNFSNPQLNIISGGRGYFSEINGSEYADGFSFKRAEVGSITRIDIFRLLDSDTTMEFIFNSADAPIKRRGEKLLSATVTFSDFS
jgi:hypothetical protein